MFLKGVYEVWKSPDRQWGFIVSKQYVIDEGLEHGSMNVRSETFRYLHDFSLELSESISKCKDNVKLLDNIYKNMSLKQILKIITF